VPHLPETAFWKFPETSIVGDMMREIVLERIDLVGGGNRSRLSELYHMLASVNENEVSY
jgi:hypothetical protein